MTTLANDPHYRAFYGCPDWCSRLDHTADEVGVDDPPVHYGPEIGQVDVQSRAVDGPFEAMVYLGGQASFVADTAELRRVAADMVRAAEWIEARV